MSGGGGGTGWVRRAQAGDVGCACIARNAEMRNRPCLKTLAYRGGANDEHAKRLCQSEGRAAMRRLADDLARDEGSFDIRYNKGGPAVSGEVTLHGEDVWVQLSLGLSGPAREVCFRKVQGRDDHLGDRNCWASIRELVDPGDRKSTRLNSSH